MGTDAKGPSAEVLLAELDWVRALARALAGADADDVVQDAWLATRRGRLDDKGKARGWLRAIVRNVARMRHRGERRRAAYHAAAVDAEAVAPAPDELLARAELQHRLATRVLALDEPFRTAVLLRFYEGLSAAEIARREAIPAGTVRWRLSRAVATLRRELEGGDGGRRWALLLLPSTTRPWRLVDGLGALFKVGVGMKVAVAAVLVVAAFALLRTHGDGGRPPNTGPPPVGTPAPVARRPSPPEGLARIAQPGAPARRLAGRVTLDGAPVAGATVELTHELSRAGLLPSERRTTDAAGRFDYGLRPAAVLTLTATAPGRAPTFVTVNLADPRLAPPSDSLELRLQPCTAVVFGTVQDATAGPITSARVCIAEGHERRACAATDAAGRYETCVAQWRTGTLVVDASGYGSVLEQISPPAGRLRRDFQLAPEGIVTGRVLTADGAPAADAIVWVAPAQFGIHGGGVSVSTASDGTGRFAAPGLASGRYNVFAHTPDESTVAPVSITAGESVEVTLRMNAGSTVRGVALDGGRPAAGVQLWLRSRARANTYSTDATTLADGSFELHGVARGPAEVKSGTHDVTQTVLVDRVFVDGVRVEVTPRGEVRGTVTREGRPVAGAVVESGTAIDETDGAGRFRLRGVPPGEHELVAQAREGHGRSVVRVGRREVVSADIELRAAAAVHGVVVDEEGGPMAGVSVGLLPADGGVGLPGATTNEDGRFQLAGLGAGRYRANVQAAELSVVKLDLLGTHEVVVPASDAVVGDVVLRVKRPRARIEGVVLDPDGSPRADVRVLALPEPGAGRVTFQDQLRNPEAVSRADGTFVLSGLVEHRHTLRARVGGAAEVVVTGVEPGARGVTLRLPAVGTLRVRLAGFGDGALVSVRRQDLGHSSAPVLAEPAGAAFLVRDLAPGRYQVAAIEGEGAAAEAVRVEPGATVEVTLTRSGTAQVHGRAIDLRTHAPVAGLDCLALLGPEVPAPTPADETSRADADGRFSLAVPSGEVAVQCVSESMDSFGAVQARPAAGQVLDVEVPVVHARRSTGGYLGMQLEQRLFGAVVALVLPHGPAATAGVRPGDVVTSVDGIAVAGLARGATWLLMVDRAIGASVALGIERGGQPVQVSVVLAPRAAVAQ